MPSQEDDSENSSLAANFVANASTFAPNERRARLTRYCDCCSRSGQTSRRSRTTDLREAAHFDWAIEGSFKPPTTLMRAVFLIPGSGVSQLGRVVEASPARRGDACAVAHSRGNSTGRLVVGNCAPDCALTGVYPRQTPSLTGRRGKRPTGGQVVETTAENVTRYVSTLLQRSAFQACSFNHSDISPYL